MMRTLTAIVVAAVAASSAGGDVVVQRWGAGGRVQHAGSLKCEPRGDGSVLMRFDLSALPKAAKVYRARLFFARRERYGPTYDMVAVQQASKDKPTELKETGRALALAPPHYRWFDATEAVRGWVKAGSETGLLLLRKAPAIDEKAAWLEIAHEGRLDSPPRQVSQVRAFYRAGQVFLTFRETEDFAGGKEDLTWGDLAGRFEGIDHEGAIPKDADGELRYRVYLHDKPITPATLGEAELIGEAAPGSLYNTRLVPSGDFIARRPTAVAARLAVEPGKPLPPGFGLFVHTVRRSGKRYYAVVAALDGVENTAEIGESNVAGPVEQKPAPPEPVLQRDETTDLRDGRTYHEQWYSYWAVPPQAPRPGRYDLAVGFCGETLARPAALEFIRGHTWGPKPEMPRPEPRRDIAMSMSTDPPNGYWTGINDARDTLKSIAQGTWRPFTHNRQEALIRWAQKLWDIDDQRIVGAIGAWGMWEIKRADLYAYIHGWGMPEVTKGFLCWDWARGAWGPPEAYQGKADEENPYVLQDYTRWVLDNPAQELPYFHVHTGWGAHFTEMGWPPFPRFARAMIDTRRAFCMQARAVEDAIRDGVIDLRRDQSLPAFGHCSLDDNIGEGDLKSGLPFGQINGYLVWHSATIVDEPGLYEITVWLWGGDSHGRNAAPLDRCTVDLTPRRCQRFRPAPGRELEWSNFVAADGSRVQGGRVAADKLSLVTIRGLTITKGKHRIMVRQVGGAAPPEATPR